MPFHHLFSFRCVTTAHQFTRDEQEDIFAPLRITRTGQRLPGPGLSDCQSRCRVSVTYSGLFDTGGDRIAHVDVDHHSISFLYREVVKKTIPIGEVDTIYGNKRQAMQLVLVEKREQARGTEASSKVCFNTLMYLLRIDGIVALSRRRMGRDTTESQYGTPICYCTGQQCDLCGAEHDLVHEPVRVRLVSCCSPRPQGGQASRQQGQGSFAAAGNYHEAQQNRLLQHQACGMPPSSTEHDSITEDPAYHDD